MRAIVCPMFVVKNVTNVNVITIRIHFRIAKVSEFLQKVESSLSILILECNCFAIGTKKNTACDAINGKCSCKVGYVGDKCDTCDNETLAPEWSRNNKISARSDRKRDQ